VNRYVTELIGTFFLVFTIGLVLLSGTELAPIAIGMMLTALVYMGAHVSGAHYNPVVTIAFHLRGAMPRADVIPYVAAQIFGAWLAATAVLLVTGETFAPAPGPDFGVVEALLAEVLFSFALILVVLNVATAKATAGNDY